MEVEAKLAVDRPATLSAIARRRRLGPYELRAVAARDLETVYLDTRGKDLLRRGAALRLRQTAAGVELTLKLPGAVESGVHRRPESTWRMRRMPILPLRLRSRRLRRPLLRWTNDRDLVPLIGTRIRRRAVLVRRSLGAVPIAEIDLDRVEFFHPGEGASVRTGRFYEVEVELLGGDDKDLQRLVEALRRRYPLRPSRLSKLERALRWAGIAAPRTRRRR
jgi:inorganic triphosphatase YgiF